MIFFTTKIIQLLLTTLCIAQLNFFLLFTNILFQGYLVSGINSVLHLNINKVALSISVETIF